MSDTAHPSADTEPALRAGPTILVFDSGLGGLTVHREIAAARPDADIVYAADTAAFPYGRLGEGVLVQRVLDVMGHLLALHEPDLVVVACNTASTLVLPPLRAAFAVPFIGTVPAIKPAAIASRTRRFSVLATPGTVARDYTLELVRDFAEGCRVKLVGSQRLAALAEDFLSGLAVSDDDIGAELMPCFVEDKGGRTDTIVLGCTHYPLLKPRFERLAPWPVAWIDPAPAIARRVVQLIGPAPSDAALAGEGRAGEGRAVFTAGGLSPALRKALVGRGLPKIEVDDLPFARPGIG